MQVFLQYRCVRAI